jgi:DNA-directed RNA polymerase beta' subunit
MYTNEDLVRFFTEGQFLLDWFLKWHGLSIGYSNTITNDKTVSKTINKNEIANAIFETDDDNLRKELIRLLGDQAIASLNLKIEEDRKRIIAHIIGRASDELKDYIKTVNLENILLRVSEVNFVKNLIREEITKAILQINALEGDPDDKDQKERNILTILNNITAAVSVYIMDNIDPTNPFNILADSGSKGSKSNIAQIMGLLGQQQINEKRPEMSMNKGRRSITYYDLDDENIEARGFIPDNFLDGVNPGGMFFHMAAGREGLVDTANKTADVGWLHHKIDKVLEDIYVSYNGCVTDRKTIFQFALLDGFDSSALIQTDSVATGKVSHFIDFQTIIGKLNLKYKN